MGEDDWDLSQDTRRDVVEPKCETVVPWSLVHIHVWSMCNRELPSYLFTVMWSWQSLCHQSVNATFQKGFTDIPPQTSGDIKEIYKAQWKHVQHLSDTFWKRWKDGYLQNLQARRKWCEERPDVKEGDVVLLRDKELHRGQWPMGLIVKTFESGNDQKVRTVEVRVIKDGKDTTYIRPITELVLLID